MKVFVVVDKDGEPEVFSTEAQALKSSSVMTKVHVCEVQKRGYSKRMATGAKGEVAPWEELVSDKKH